MPATTQPVKTFPNVRLPSHSRGLPVEVDLIAQLGIGAGDQVIHGVIARQGAHAAYIDALDEPSARIGAMHPKQGDATSLYTFAVGTGGHPFHRHAGHRVFTAISGSAGTLLRFSTASSAQIDADPREFVRALRHVAIPPDCLFTVRFGGGTWHQFLSLRPQAKNPALFALSCHTNELGGELPEPLRALVAANAADIPALTEVLPPELDALLADLDPASVPTIALSLHEAPVSLLSALCASTRSAVGPLRSWASRRGATRGFRTDRAPERPVREHATAPDNSLLRTQLADAFDHEDCFTLALDAADVGPASAGTLLEAVLDGFLRNRSTGVTALMRLRNVLVYPLRLRTSPLGCPVSSLLGPCAAQQFAGRFPVLAQDADLFGTRAQVILGADDRHLRFRSCVAVEKAADGGAVVTLATRVQYLNWFGRLYMALIERVHRGYIAPTMLRLAVDHAVRGLRAEDAG